TKLLDFGLAKVTATTDKSLAKTRTGVLLGTVGYMSPEQAEGEPVDPRSDVFSFGSVLYEMVAGKPAFERQTSIKMLMAIMAEDPIALDKVNANVPDPLCAIVEKCLAKKRDERYSSARELAADLGVLREQLTVERSTGLLPFARRERKRTWLLSSLGAAAVITLAIVLWPDGGDDGGETQSAPLSFGAAKQLETSEEQLRSPALSPDGKRVAFVAVRGGQADLYVRRVAARKALRLTEDLDDESEVAFSPDGETVAYSAVRRKPLRSEVRLVPALGGQITTVIAGAGHPAWSPDGRHLAFVRYAAAAGYELVTSRLDGADQKTVLKGDAAYPFLFNPAWSPDGKTLAVVRGRGGAQHAIWLVPVDGGTPRRLADDTADSSHPVFAAGGVVCASTKLGARNLWFFPLDGSEPTQLTRGAGPEGAPSVAKDGTLLYHTARWRQTLRVVDLETDEERELLRQSTYMWAPTFSPDGTLVAFSRAEADNGCHIWVMPLAGGPPRQLTFGDVPEVFPRFDPEGAMVTYYTWSRTTPDRCLRVPVGGGTPRRITPQHDAEEGYAEISPDGQQIVFVRQEGAAAHVYIAPARGDEARRLTETRGTTPCWSPQGKWIAFAADRGYSGGITIVRPDGTGERKLAARGGWPRWWPDGRRVAYLVVGPDGNQRIETASLDGGPPVLLEGVTFHGLNHPFDISPDGRRLVSSNSVHLISEIWVMHPDRK
ncbi:MAG: protein kinase, partial [Planctomycetota bacterium]|nr:protein kinase [Planctomycetota bacterium]